MTVAVLVRQIDQVRRVRKSGALAVLALLVALVCAARGGDTTPTASYSVPFELPFHISIGKQDGRPTVSGNVSWITDLGVITVYHPFMLSSWAYDDSTVTKWYGTGFAWFLLRLVLACFLGMVDLFFTILFYFGQIIVTLFGNSVWPGGLG